MSDLPAPPNSRYRLLNRLGSGGMGDVYAAMDETLRRRVALKAIQAHRRLNAESRDRFLREARILSQLDHPNICRAYDYVQGDDADWLVMELVEGRSVTDLLKGGPVGAEITKIAEDIAAVLVVTHAAGIVHRDLKPGNVMITHTGDAKVLDFGIASSGDPRPAPAKAAAARADAETATSSTIHDPDETRALVPADVSIATAAIDADETRLGAQRSATVGTLPYMAPEQARGEVASSASDIFSFGLLLQEMITGQGAYPRTLDKFTLLERVQQGQTEPFRDASELGALVRRMLSLAPSQRPTAVEAVARLKWIRDTPKRRLRRGLIAAGVLIAALAGVKYTVDLSRERNIAVAAEAEANRRRGQAEDLIGFMVGDLRSKLEKAGRLDLLDSVGGKAMDYFAAVPATSLSGEELSQRAQAIYQIGAVRQAQGNLKAARESFDESLAVAEQLAARDPMNADWQLRLGTAYFYAGDIRRRENDLTGALKYFTAYRDIALALSARDPANMTWALEVSFGHSNVAAIQELQGDLAGAKLGLELSLAIKEKVSAADPKKVARRADVANGHNRLGVVLGKLGEPDAALAHYEQDVAIRRALVAAEPTNQALKRPLGTAMSFVGGSHEDAGDLLHALAQYRAVHDIVAPLAESDVANVTWQRDLGTVERQLGDVLRAMGRGAEARARYAHAQSILGPIAARTPTDVGWQRDLAKAELGLGSVEMDRGNAGGARAAAANISRLLTPLFAKKPDADTAMLLIEGELLAADAADRAGQHDAARSARESSLSIARMIKGAHPRRLRAAEAHALVALGRSDESRTIVTELERLGYRHWSLTPTKRKLG